MHFNTETRLDHAIERTFTLDGIRGVLWVPATADAPAPLILAGQPGALPLEASYHRIADRAVTAARDGLATVTIELPGAGERPQPAGVAEARQAVQDAVRAGRPVPEEVAERLILPVVAQAVPEWQAVLDAATSLPEIAARCAWSGGLASLGVRLALTEPRIVATVLFVGSLVPRSVVAEARQVTVPTHFLVQWDDEGNDRQRALDLYDALGSREKTLTANLGGHLGVPQSAREATEAFLVRHLRRPAA